MLILGGLPWPEWKPEAWIAAASTGIALLALVVSALTFFMVNLRRGDIFMVEVPEGPKSLGSSGWMGGLPTDLRMRADVYAYNSGARRGVVFNSDLKVSGSFHDVFTLAGSTFKTSGEYQQGGELPLVMQGNDLHILHLIVRLKFKPVPGLAANDPNAAEIVWDHIRKHLKPDDTVPVTLAYTVSAGHSLNPWRWRRARTKKRKLILQVPVAPLYDGRPESGNAGS